MVGDVVEVVGEYMYVVVLVVYLYLDFVEFLFDCCWVGDV